MTEPTFRLVKGRSDRSGQMFTEWFASLDVLAQDYWRLDNFNPFAENEAASVSGLVAAAARANFQAIAEWPVRKTRENYEGRGRLDLWINRKNTSYSFEFKRWRNWKGKLADLERTMSFAEGAIREVDPTEHKRAFAGVIAPFHNVHCTALFDEYAKSCSIVAYTGKAGQNRTAFFFKEFC